MKQFAFALFAASLLATPALALSYPVQGRYGESNEIVPGLLDCTGKRVIRFDDVRRFDNRGGVPDYRMIELLHEGNTAFRITEEFHTGQIRAQHRYLLRLIDSERIELALDQGGTLKLKRCA